MLVIKMLKKASGMNNIELAEYLGKTRNTIASWEANEENIPNTEKIKLCKRFNFDYEYWNIGLDKATSYYQSMYSDIKNGYLVDSMKLETNNESRVDEILRFCDGGNIETYQSSNDSNEYIHYKYIGSLLDGIDPIDNSMLDEDHFINNYKKYFDNFDMVESKFKNDDSDIVEELDEEFYLRLQRLKDFRNLCAKEEGILPFQVLSDEVLKNILLAYINGNKELKGIKNFPVGGVKWNKYYDAIREELEAIV